jgi:capsid protein
MLQSHSEQIAEHSGDQFEMVMAQIARENELKESLGLMSTVEQPTDSTAEPAQPDDPDQDEGSETQPRRP